MRVVLIKISYYLFIIPTYYRSFLPILNLRLSPTSNFIDGGRVMLTGLSKYRAQHTGLLPHTKLSILRIIHHMFLLESCDTSATCLHCSSATTCLHVSLIVVDRHVSPTDTCWQDSFTANWSHLLLKVFTDNGDCILLAFRSSTMFSIRCCSLPCSLTSLWWCSLSTDMSCSTCFLSWSSLIFKSAKQRHSGSRCNYSVNVNTSSTQLLQLTSHRHRDIWVKLLLVNRSSYFSPIMEFTSILLGEHCLFTIIHGDLFISRWS